MVDNICFYSSPIGLLEIHASETHLTKLLLNSKGGVADVVSTGVLTNCITQLDEYFAGRRKLFDLPLQLEGTAFQRQVWTALQSIPYGQTISYKQLAIKIANSKACRAVGTANGHNPFPILIPCHRVVNANGGLGGYTGGLHIKQYLLRLESGKS